MQKSADDVAEFVLTYFDLLGASIEEAAPGLYRVELARELAAELEGDAMPAWMWSSSPHLPAHVTYYFTFSPEVAEKHPDAELISPGSHRLQQVIRSVREIGRATRAHLPIAPFIESGVCAPHELCYRPFHLFCLRLDFHGGASFSGLFPVAVDLVDLLPLRQLAELIPRLDLEPGSPPEAGIPVETPRAGLKASFAVAYREVLESLERSDPSWAQHSLQAIERERERLLTYFAAAEQDGVDVREQRALRLDELERMHPRVFVEPRGVCETYLPVRVRGGSVQHLVLGFRHAGL